MVKAVVGANWGDEGKGKMTDMLASEADYVVRLANSFLSVMHENSNVTNFK